MNNPEIVSSTGRLGLERRTFGRYYFNHHKPLDFLGIQRLKILGEKAIEKKENNAQEPLADLF